MKAYNLATAAGLVMAAAAHAQTVQFNTNARVFGNTFGEGTVNANQQPLVLNGGGGASFTLSAAGGSGQTGGGLVDGILAVANSMCAVNASITGVPGGWQRSRFIVHGEAHLLQTSGYSVTMNSNLGVLSGDQEVKLIITNPTPVFFFIESSGILSSNTSLTDGVTTYPSGSNIPAGTYTMLSSLNAFISMNNSPPADRYTDGALNVYLANPRCASALAWSRRATSGPSGRYVPATAYDRDRSRVLLFGGGTSVPLARFNDLWEWDGVSWTQRQPDDGAAVGRPNRRRASAMAYDSTGHRFYLFGGETDAGFTNEFWRLDAATLTWTNLTATVPAGLTARWSPAMVFDRERNVCVLYGGGTPTASPVDTWEFNGTSWVLKPSATNPGPRVSAGMVYDTLRGRTVVFGGGTYSQLPATDTPWTWNGTSWQALTTNAGPAPSFGPGMAFDEARGRIVLMGGATLPILNTTWELNGSTWTQISSPAGMAGRAGHLMTYDAAHGHIVAFGGLNQAQGYESDTWAHSWPQISQHPVNVSVATGQPASFTVGVSAAALSYQWFKGASLIIGANSPTYSIPSVQAAHLGSYTVVVNFTCGAQTSAAATLSILSCYPNCDNSTATPVLTANDFQCFLNKFAAADSYANCDNSTATPILTANDFQCFLNAYAAGCS